MGGWVDARKAVDYVDWALLLLVGSALGLSKAITNSGLAGYAGDAIGESGMSASVSLYVIYGFTVVRRTLQLFCLLAPTLCANHFEHGYGTTDLCVSRFDAFIDQDTSSHRAEIRQG